MTRQAQEPPIDYTEMAHHNEMPDAHASADPSSPQGPFWRPEDKNRVADEIAKAPLGPRRRPDEGVDEPGEPVREK